MADKELSWRFAEEFPDEPAPAQTARRHALEHGIEAVTAATGAQLAVLVATAAATRLVEIGTGAGVSGSWMLHAAPQATLTSIDLEPDHQVLARTAFTEAGAQPARLRLIAGRAAEVLPRLNDAAYDLVFVDADPGSVLDYVEHGLRIVRPGGVVAVAHALWRGRVADPAQRDELTAQFRALQATIAESSAVVSAMGTAGDGLLQIVTRAD
ncbi:MAG: class I SAM-dependent methyltransferase [Actinomycetales bacterium]|nr:class I SAM-dependent methyltransferase [Actinomycetales bacterium]